MEQKAAKAVLLSKHSAKMRVLLINTSERIGGARGGQQTNGVAQE